MGAKRRNKNSPGGTTTCPAIEIKSGKDKLQQLEIFISHGINDNTLQIINYPKDIG